MNINEQQLQINYNKPRFFRAEVFQVLENGAAI